MRRRGIYSEVRHRRGFHGQSDQTNEYHDGLAEETKSHDSNDFGSKEGWKNSEGERLDDFGVDEEAEFYDEEDTPLAVLLERRRQRNGVVAY